MTICTSSRALAEVDVAAFISNLKLAASLHSGDRLLPVIKLTATAMALRRLPSRYVAVSMCRLQASPSRALPRRGS
jgi:hypothetical protein